MARRGFTLIEMLCVIAIIAVLAALLMPVLASAMRASKETVAISNVKQLHLAFSLYRSEYDGDVRYGKASEMGLPDMTRIYTGAPWRLLPGTEKLWASPCGQHVDTTKAETAGTNLDYHASDIEDETWASYAQRRQEEAVLVYDLNCSAPDAILHSPYMLKKVIGVRLNGSLVRRTTRELLIDLAAWDH